MTTTNPVPLTTETPPALADALPDSLADSPADARTEAPKPAMSTEELQKLVESLDDVNTTKIPVVRIVTVKD